MKIVGISGLALATALLGMAPAQAEQSTAQQSTAQQSTGAQSTGAQSGTQAQQGTAAQQGSQTQATAGTAAGSGQEAQADGGAAGAGEIRPLTVTCQDIVDTDVKLVPQLVYWIDGYNLAYDASSGQTDVDPIVTVKENWLAVPAQNVITACEADPSRVAADVISEQKQKAETGTN